IVNPGFFRTELLEPASVTYAKPSIEDYADRTAEQLKWWQAQGGKQGGDPAKLARALVTRSEEHTSELQSLAYLVCRLLPEKKMVERGQFSLSDPVHKYLPEFQGPRRAKVRLPHLLPNTSVLPDSLPANVKLRAATTRLATV